MTQSNAIDMAWAAGLFEGEGTVFYSPKKNNVTLALVMTDRDVVARFAEIIGVNLMGPFQRAEWKPYWRVETRDRRKVRRIYDDLRPHLGERRREQFDSALGALVVRRLRQGESGFPSCGETVLGSQSGYHRHRRAGEIPCDECKLEFSRYQAKWRAARSSTA